MMDIFRDFEEQLLEQGYKGKVDILLEDNNFEDILLHPDFNWIYIQKPIKDIVAFNISGTLTLKRRNG